MIMLNYVSHELANKVYHLTKALNEAEKIIKSLDEENKNLKEVLEKLESSEQHSHEYAGAA